MGLVMAGGIMWHRATLRKGFAEVKMILPLFRSHVGFIKCSFDPTARHGEVAVDHEGEVLENYVIKMREKKAALKFIKKLCVGMDGPTRSLQTDFDLTVQ